MESYGSEIYTARWTPWKWNPKNNGGIAFLFFFPHFIPQKVFGGCFSINVIVPRKNSIRPAKKPKNLYGYVAGKVKKRLKKKQRHCQKSLDGEGVTWAEEVGRGRVATTHRPVIKCFCVPPAGDWKLLTFHPRQEGTSQSLDDRLRKNHPATGRGWAEPQTILGGGEPRGRLPVRTG